MTYRLAGESLRIEYEAESDADTLCSLTNHSYFNLNGGGTAMAHTLALAAERYLETSPGCLPTGRALSVAGTPLTSAQLRLSAGTSIRRRSSCGW